ncbi:monosaccharide-sensing protein 1-like isoform X2 [Bombyx mandarina]|uniref:Monosaccharide-sensing protein 1-like isoform X2 n=1 Tax=Bombyx mandarina TaxID=7092 RepID=A0A6J2KQB7_BOMMA|nr:monosaccharide-sensing protein 1-like isoform X2 [Bombyx mandarina]
MPRRRQWMTPFIKQCFVTSGVTLNMLTHGFMYGFNTGLFAQLRKTKEIQLDLELESWLASSTSLSFIVGSLFSSIFMDRFGRRPAFIIASATMIISWLIFIAAKSFTALLVAKIFQGFSAGVESTTGYILVGEYVSPNHRASFLASFQPVMLFGDFLTHGLSSICDWRNVAIILAFLSIPGLALIVFSPESPSFLAKIGKHDQCKKVFYWLRGLNENNEVEMLIKTNLPSKQNAINNDKINGYKKVIHKLSLIGTFFKKREVRISLFIMVHMQLINLFSGSILYDIYTVDIHTAVFGTDKDQYMYLIVMYLDIVRILSSIFSVFLTQKMRRRSMLLSLVGLNILMYLLLGIYVLCKNHNLLPFDHISIGIILYGFNYFSLAAGSVSLPNIVAGEIFPLANRSACGMICNITFSLYMFVNIKNVPYIFSGAGVSGVFFMNAALLSYALGMTMYTLPETKDKTLLEIENILRGCPIADDDETMINLKEHNETNF